MKSTRMIMSVAAAALVVCVAPAWGQIVEIVPWSLAGGGMDSLSSGHAFDGGYGYFGQGSPSRIIKVDVAGGTQTMLLDPGTWAAAGGSGTSFSVANGFRVVGDDVCFTETSTDQLWKVNKNTGAVSMYMSEADIIAVTGQASSSSLSSYEVLPNGEFVWYEGASDSILMSNGAHNLSILVADTELAALQGNDSVNSGIAVDAAGNIYWGDSTTESIYMRATDGTLSMALGVGAIAAVTGEPGAAFGDFMGAPDGLMYFYERDSDGIVRFDPADPAGTVELFVHGQSIYDAVVANNGVDHTSNVSMLGWYDGQLTANFYNSSSQGKFYGTYSIPEPASLGLLALGGLLALRRRR